MSARSRCPGALICSAQRARRPRRSGREVDHRGDDPARRLRRASRSLRDPIRRGPRGPPPAGSARPRSAPLERHAARSPSSASSPTRRSPTRCRRRGSTSSTPRATPVSSSWRPQEAFGLQVFDQTVRNMNAQPARARCARGGKRAKLGFAITTGDLADNQQLNETRWFKARARRRARSTRSPASRSAPPTRAGGASAEAVAALNAAVAARGSTPASPTTTTTPASPPTATAASGTRTSARRGGRTPRSRATRG